MAHAASPFHPTQIAHSYLTGQRIGARFEVKQTFGGDGQLAQLPVFCLVRANYLLLIVRGQHLTIVQVNMRKSAAIKDVLGRRADLPPIPVPI